MEADGVTLALVERLGVELADLLTTIEATGDDGVALTLSDLLTITEATGDDDGVAFKLAEVLMLGVELAD